MQDGLRERMRDNESQRHVQLRYESDRKYIKLKLKRASGAHGS